MTDNLESLYVEAKSALKAGEYDHAAELLTQIIAVDENYKDVSRLLAQTVRLKRRRWYSHPALWTVIALAVVTGLGAWILPRLAAQTTPVENPSAPVTLPTSSPTATIIFTQTNIPIITPSPMPTAIPLKWKRIYMGQEFPRDVVTGLIIDADDPDLLFAETQHAGIYKTINGGVSWSPAQKAELTDKQAGLLSLASHAATQNKFSNTAPDGIERLYGYGDLADSSSFSYWHVSEDAGATWKRFSEGGTFREFTPIAFDRLGFVYVFCGRNICKYDPDGTPLKILKQPDIHDQSVIALSPTYPNTIYAAGDGISVSRDGGSTWTRLNDGMGSDVLRLSAGLGSFPFLYLQSGECFVQTNNEGLEQPLYRSSDGGLTWNHLTNKGCNLAGDADGVTLYRHAESQMWRSSNEGSTWAQIPIHFSARILFPNLAQSGVLYAQQEGRSTNWMVSSNYGVSWDESPNQDLFRCYESTNMPIVIDPRNANRVFLVSEGSLLKSYNSCRNYVWGEQNQPGEVNAAVIDLVNPDILYLGANTGAYISYDSGATWGQVNDGLLGATVVYSIAVDKESNVYAATPYGIFKLESR